MKTANARTLPEIERPRPFELLPEHRQRPGWQWLWDRLFQPLPDEREAVTDAALDADSRDSVA